MTNQNAISQFESNIDNSSTESGESVNSKSIYSQDDFAEVKIAKQDEIFDSLAGTYCTHYSCSSISSPSFTEQFENIQPSLSEPSTSSSSRQSEDCCELETFSTDGQMRLKTSTADDEQCCGGSFMQIGEEATPLYPDDESKNDDIRNNVIF